MITPLARIVFHTWLPFIDKVLWQCFYNTTLQRLHLKKNLSTQCFLVIIWVHFDLYHKV